MTLDSWSSTHGGRLPSAAANPSSACSISFRYDAIVLVPEPVPRISRHGKPGQRASACSRRHTAASLMTCSLRSTAASVFESYRNESSILCELLDGKNCIQYV